MASTQICSVESCNKRQQARGWCAGHYYKWHRYGDPLGGRELGATRVFIEKIAVPFAGDECLIWPFYRDGKGYGKLDQKPYGTAFAHRAVCILVHGAAPTASHQAAHSCGNGHLGCVNPNHLRWATPKQNTSDIILHGRMPRGEKHGVSKLTEAQVKEIKSLKGAEPGYILCERFDVSEMTIYRIWSGKIWAWLG